MMILLSVNQGDSINLTVNANYETTPSGNDWLETAHGVLFNAFNTSYGEVIEGGVATSEWSDALHGVQMSPKHETSDAPRAFLNYILFDQNMNYVTAGFEQLSTAAHGVGVHETLSMDGIVAEQEGYILAYLSNENAEPVNVHFDDFTVTQTKTRVVSSQDYYPFGGTFNSFTRNYSEPQRFKYNGKELEEETGWSDFGARQYDRWSGRWMGMDPLGDLRNWVSPYNFVQNNPINRVDPDGALDREIRSLTVINRVERIDGDGKRPVPSDDITAKKDGTIEIVKTDDNFDRFFVENNDQSTTQVAQLDKVTAADGKTTLVRFPESGNGFTRYGDEEAGGDRYVQPTVAASLFGAINEFSNNNLGATIQLGNMSAANGGKPGVGVHKGGSMSHVNGRNVDVRLIRNDRALSGVTVFDSQFDRGANQSMVNSFNKFGFKSILSYPTKDGFLMNNTKNIDDRLYNNPKHHNHLHLQGYSPKLINR